MKIEEKKKLKTGFSEMPKLDKNWNNDEYKYPFLFIVQPGLLHLQSLHPIILTISISPNYLNINDIDIIDIWGGDSDDETFGSPIKQLFIDSPLVKFANEPCSATDCAICMENLTSVDLMITRCGHQFHSTCMITHLKRQDNCPLCRGILCK